VSECALALAVLFVLAGCAPVLDWREVRPEGSAARVLFPCRPASHARALRLGGDQVEMSMYSCAAGGTVYALSFAKVKDPARVRDAVDDLAVAVQSHFQPLESAASQPAALRGTTPAGATNWRLAGRLRDGRPMQERTVLFSHGTHVYQATMLGSSLDAEAQEMFFDALRVGS
jgi:hypothetical protein